MEIKSIINETSEEFFCALESHLLFDEKPSIFLNEILSNTDRYSYDNDLIKALYNLKGIRQNPEFNSEIDVLTHTLYVVDEAAKYKSLANDKKAFMFAALLHDIGTCKTAALSANKIIDEHHSVIGGEMTRRLLRGHITDLSLRNHIVSLIKHHMIYLYVLNRIKTSEVLNMIQNTDIHDVALLSLCDGLGKEILSKESKEATLNDINKFLDIISSKTGISYEKISINF